MSENSETTGATEPVPPRTDPGRTAPPAPGPQPSPGSGTSGSDDFFNRIRGTGAVRPDDHRWAAGVAVGLARRMNVDPLLVRGIFVALAVIGGLGLLLYGVAWLLMPQQDGRIHAQEALHGRITAGFVGAVICILLDLGRGTGPLWWQFGFLHFDYSLGGLLTLVIVGLAVWWWATRQGPGSGPGAGGTGGAGGSGGTTTPGAPPPTWGGAPMSSPATGTGGTAWGPQTFSTGGPHTLADPAPPGAQQPAPPAQRDWAPRIDPAAPSRTITRATLGSALLAAGIVALIDRTAADLPGPTWLLAATVALGVVAIGVVVAGVLGRRAGGLAPIGVLLAAAVLLGAVLPAPESFSVLKSRTWRPVSVVEGEAGLTAGVGDGTLDLSDAGLITGASAADPVRVDSSLGIGELRVIPPAGQSVEIRASVGAGNVVQKDSVGRDSRQLSSGADVFTVIRTGPSGPPLLVVTVKVGLGQIAVISDQPVQVTP
jgi:phage shock protein PspC (stress-responsive transcriptional regulator)